MKTVRKILLLICLMLTAFSCQKNLRWPVKSSDRKMIPYQIGDTVRFINACGEIVTLVVTTDTKSWDYDDVYVETETVVLASDSGNYKLSLSVEGRADNIRCLLFGMNSSGGIAFYNPKGNLLSWGESSVFDSVLIGNHVYYNVAVSNTSPIDGPTQGFYNKAYGVLQMTKNGEPVFTLDTVVFAKKR